MDELIIDGREQHHDNDNIEDNPDVSKEESSRLTDTAVSAALIRDVVSGIYRTCLQNQSNADVRSDAGYIPDTRENLCIRTT